ncbi:uncharacterized protein LOC142077326 isoform X1 [Calonectris borealis]|uniref:uncharacterized protein LOC142077326 isoform X1 n=1 Tax=Calonectris borealis TaxID=1323832 RepID=UPI003F4BFD5C
MLEVSLQGPHGQEGPHEHPAQHGWGSSSSPQRSLVPPTTSCHVPSTQLAQAEPGTGRRGVQDPGQEAEAPGTDQGASQDSVQSSTPMVSSKERRWCGVAPGLWGLGLQTLSLCSAVRMQGEIHQDLHDTIQDLNSKVLHQEIKQLEEALEQEEICQQQRKKEAEAPGTVLLEVVEAQLERDMLARRRGFIYWLQTLCLLLVGLQLAVGFALAAAVLYAAWYDPELFYRLLLRVLCEETYAHLAYALGEILPVVSEGLLPF